MQRCVASLLLMIWLSLEDCTASAQGPLTPGVFSDFLGFLYLRDSASAVIKIRAEPSQENCNPGSDGCPFESCELPNLSNEYFKIPDLCTVDGCLADFQLTDGFNYTLLFNVSWINNTAISRNIVRIGDSITIVLLENNTLRLQVPASNTDLVISKDLQQDVLPHSRSFSIQIMKLISGRLALTLFFGGEATQYVQLSTWPRNGATLRVVSANYSGTDPDVRLFNKSLTAGEVYALHTGEELKFPVRSECHCPESSPDDFGFWFGGGVQFSHCFNPEGVQSPRFRYAGLPGLLLPEFDFWNSVQTEKLTLILDFPMPFRVFGLTMTLIGLPSSLEVHIEDEKEGSSRAVAFATDDCIRTYKMKAFVWPSDGNYRDSAGDLSTRCYHWRDYAVRFPDEAVHQLTIPFLPPNYVDGSGYFVGSTLRLQFKAQSNDWTLSARNLSIYGRAHCNDEGTSFIRTIRSVTDYVSVYTTPPVCNCLNGFSGSQCTECADAIERPPTWRTPQGICKSCSCYWFLSSQRNCDPETGQCPCVEGGDPSKAGRKCLWYIDTVSPLFGPVAGGTKVTAIGGYLNQVDVFNTEQFNRRAANLSYIEFLTGPFPSENESVALTLTYRYWGIGQIELFPSMSYSFESRPNPIIEQVSNARSTLSGGLNITVTGKFLDSVSEPQMIVYLRLTDTILRTFNMTCHVESTWLMICPTPDMNVAYIAIINGVMPSNISTTTAAGNNSEGLIPTTMQPSARRRRQINGADSPDPNALNGKKSITFTLGFMFDGHKRYEDLLTTDDKKLRSQSNLIVYENPVFSRFTEEENVKVLEPSEYVVISVFGERIDFAANTETYRVVVGEGGISEVTDISSNELRFKPPLQQPNIAWKAYKKFNGREVPNVEVYLGNLKFSVGYLMYKTSPWDDMSFRAGMISLIVIVVVLVAAIAVLWYMRRRARKAEYNVPDELRLHSRSAEIPWAAISPELRTQVDRCKIPCEHLSIGPVVGKGNFGRVYKGQLRVPSSNRLVTVAIKSLKEDNASLDEMEGFLREATLMIEFRHPNVLSLIGIVWPEADKPLVVLPYMENGDLKSLVMRVDMSFTLGDLLHLALQIANGMHYLEAQKFVHRDLAARNCMADADFLAKIADFGLSRDIYEKDYYRTEDRNRPLPIKWMAIESIKTGKFSSKSDVWSYGVTLWEILTRGSTPYPGVDNYNVSRYVESGERMSKPEFCPLVIYELMQQCWLENPQKRPSFLEIIDLISGVLRGSSSPQFNEEEYSYAREITKHIADDYQFQPSNDGPEYINVSPNEMAYLLPVSSRSAASALA